LIRLSLAAWQPGSGVLGFAVLNASRLFFGPDGKDVMSMPRYGMYGSNLTQEMDRNMDGLTWFDQPIIFVSWKFAPCLTNPQPGGSQ
jgi:hypothetical protein